MPTLIGLMVAVGVLRESGFMTDLGNALGKFTDPIGFPGQLMPVTIVKIFSPQRQPEWFLIYLRSMDLIRT